ncbi:unnamed protein product, partial [Rotaria magnacalcarata]
TTATLTSLKSIQLTEKNSNGQPRLATVIMTSTDNSALKENEDVLLELPKVACATTMPTSNNLNKPNQHPPPEKVDFEK